MDPPRDPVVPVHYPRSFPVGTSVHPLPPAGAPEKPHQSWGLFSPSEYSVKATPSTSKPSGPPLYETFAVDFVRSERKSTSVIRRSELPESAIPSAPVLVGCKWGLGVPSVFLMNWALPLADPPNPLWGTGETDGEGFNILIYTRLSAAARAPLGPSSSFSLSTFDSSCHMTQPYQYVFSHTLSLPLLYYALQRLPRRLVSTSASGRPPTTSPPPSSPLLPPPKPVPSTLLCPSPAALTPWRPRLARSFPGAGPAPRRRLLLPAPRPLTRPGSSAPRPAPRSVLNTRPRTSPAPLCSPLSPSRQRLRGCTGCITGSGV